MKKTLSIASILTLAVIAINTLVFSDSNTGESDDSFQKRFNNNYRVFALNLPEKAKFVNELVPLEKNDVRERLDKEMLVNTYWQSQGLLFFKRANKYFPIIEPILKEKGVPDDFKYLAVIESGLENVTSSAGAKGFWQLMPKTAKEHNMEVNKNVDERYDVVKSTYAACDYLLSAKKKFGSWTLAAASYNMGKSGVQRQLDRQKVSNYYDLLLNTETGRYVYRIIAVKNIMNNPKDYGFYFREKDLYKRSKTKQVVVDTAVSNLADFAIAHKINYKELKLYNPWLREINLNNKSRKKYTIEIPIK
ncbi:MAG: lytic transglycosylase domain-containing protein [Ichthyobacteriaceae bacterium]|nr:lytic transglycosylase domain-containing protein [Ichthyobacteriaceae bacterium]